MGCLFDNVGDILCKGDGVIMIYRVIDSGDGKEMDFVDHFEAKSEETAAKHAITVLGFGHESAKELKTRTAVEVLGGLGYHVEEIK